MTALEYMEQQLMKHAVNYGRAVFRNATKDEIQGIQNKIEYYKEAVAALKEKGSKKMNEAVKLDEINPCAVCRDCVGCAVCHREEKDGE